MWECHVVFSVISLSNLIHLEKICFSPSLQLQTIFLNESNHRVCSTSFFHFKANTAGFGLCPAWTWNNGFSLFPSCWYRASCDEEVWSIWKFEHSFVIVYNFLMLFRLLLAKDITGLHGLCCGYCCVGSASPDVSFFLSLLCQIFGESCLLLLPQLPFGKRQKCLQLVPTLTLLQFFLCLFEVINSLKGSWWFGIGGSHPCCHWPDVSLQNSVCPNAIDTAEEEDVHTWMPSSIPLLHCILLTGMYN